MGISKELQTRLKNIDKLRADLKKAEKSVSKEIMTALRDLMKDNPLLEGIRWNQYTPHFNDGDVCEFGVNGPEFKFSETLFPLEGEDDDRTDRDSHGDYHNDGWYDDYTINDEFFTKRTDIFTSQQIASLKKTVDNVYTVFNRLTHMESELQSMFGDGVQITVTAKGVETEDYDHD